MGSAKPLTGVEPGVTGHSRVGRSEPPVPDSDQALLAAVAADLNQGQGATSPALELLVRRHGPALRALAASILGDAVLADDVVQETWMAAFRSAAGYQGRSSVRTWLLSICANRARTNLVKERRVVPFTRAWRNDRAEPFDPSAFSPAGSWVVPVTSWDDLPFAVVSAAELRDELTARVARLPLRQRQVVVARDMLGCTPSEVTELYGITSGNQRVLLHHARATLRAALLADAKGTDGP